MVTLQACLKSILVMGIVLTAAQNGLAAAAGETTLSPYFYIENGDPSLDRFPLKNTAVVVNINGVIADVVISQTYANDGNRPIDARYIFPASTRAAVHGMKMVIGHSVINAEIQERRSAQKNFEKARQQGQSASLLEQQRPNVFSMNIANVMPGDTIEVELHYTELLVPSEAVYEFVYPAVVGPRYSTQSNQSKNEATPSDRWIRNPYLPQGGEPRTKFSMHATIATGIALQELACPSHEVQTRWESDAVANVSLAQTSGFGGDRDFILTYRLAGEDIQTGLLLFEGGDEKFFLLMVQPPEHTLPRDIPPREYIFVVDVSGSMSGFPLNTAKTLLRDLIGNLKETDRFNLILFAGGSPVLAKSSIPASPVNIRHAVRLIETQRGGGGTELLSALRKGLALPRDDAFARTMIIVTDGYIGAEREVFEEIQQNLDRTNVFAFGIGSSVNRHLIEGMAKAGQGKPFVVTDPRQANTAAASFRRYVQVPLLTDVELEYENFEAYDTEPPAIPDLFADRPVIVFGKWRGRPGGAIELTGAGGHKDVARSVHVGDTRPMAANRALRYLWARSRIARISGFTARMRNPERKKEITTLGLTYNLLTAYTSFIAVHQVVRNSQGPGNKVVQPLPLPRYVSNLAVGGLVSTVPEPKLYWLLIIALALPAIGMAYKKYRT